MIKNLIKKHQNIHSILVGMALIFFWRGIWILTEMYLFPNNHTLSAIICIVVGLFILYIDDRKFKELNI